MDLNGELRTMLAAQAEREAPPIDAADLLVRAKSRRQRHRASRVAVVAATVAVLGAGTFGATQIARSAPEPTAPTAPRPTGEPPQLKDSTCPGRCLEPGTYRIPLGADGGRTHTAEVTVDAEGWASAAYLNRVSSSGPQGEVMLNVYEPRAFAGVRPCQADEVEVLEPGTTVAEVGRRLTRLPQFDVVHGPTPVPAFGREALQLQVHADRIRCEQGTDPDPESYVQYNLAEILGPEGPWNLDSDIDPGQPVQIDFWLVDLEGHVIVVEVRQEGTVTTDMVEQLAQVRESLHLVVLD